uniref:NEK6-subfamily protein kinase n=1 Tax=Globodera rostochiensis TaxID=31243 RepID=A0A914H3I1_GLORO
MSLPPFTACGSSPFSPPPPMSSQRPQHASPNGLSPLAQLTPNSPPSSAAAASNGTAPPPSSNEQHPTNQYGSFEHFEMEKKIGKGQFSEVLSARNKLTGNMVALKKIEMDLMKNKKAREDCRKEIDLLKKLNHENIIRYYSSFIMADQSKEYLMIVLELAGAGDLNKLLRNFKKNFRLIPERSVWKYFVQIARAVHYMHSKSIMHRDIKPANVFMTTSGVVKLGDLGLGRFLSLETLTMSTFKKGMVFSIVGTPYYMSPERMNEMGYSFKSDIWSLGCVLYEMAALQSPFFGEKQNLLALVRKISKCEYPPIPANIYSQQLRLTIANCICTNPARRFDAQDVLTVSEHMHSHFSALSKSAFNSVHGVTGFRSYNQTPMIRRFAPSANRCAGGGSVSLPPVCPTNAVQVLSQPPTKL